MSDVFMKMAEAFLANLQDPSFVKEAIPRW